MILWLLLLPEFSSENLTVNTTAREYIVTGRAPIPVLSYHNIKKNATKNDLLFISEQQFNRQMKGLFDSGYHTILPNQLIQYYKTGTGLPQHPILISFDDAHVEHYSIAAPILQQYGFKGIFFVMTVTINKKGYLSSNQIQQLSNAGHIIGAHTWDHPNIAKLNNRDYALQLNKPKKLLEQIISKPVDCFAYPFGACNEESIIALSNCGYTTAFQLAGAENNNYPLFTIRRQMVNGSLSPASLQKQIHTTFQ